VRAHTAELASAATPDATTTAMQALAGDYGDAARSLGRLDLSPADRAVNGRLVTALDRTSGAYRDTSQTRIDAAKVAIERAIASLEAAGYLDGAVPAPSRPEDGADESRPESGVGDSRSDDPSDDEPDEDDNGTEP
jgi:hypothetical protein